MRMYYFIINLFKVATALLSLERDRSWDQLGVTFNQFY